MSWHKKDWLFKAILPAAAIAGTAFGLPSLGLLGGAAGAAEAGAGAAAGAGSGLLGADYAALGLGGSGALSEAAPYAGELASVGASGGSMLGGASPQAISPLAGDWSGVPSWLQNAASNFPSPGKVGKGLETYQRLAQFNQMLQQPQQQQAPQMPRAQPQQNTSLEELFKRMLAYHGGA